MGVHEKRISGAGIHLLQSLDTDANRLFYETDGSGSRNQFPQQAACHSSAARFALGGIEVAWRGAVMRGRIRTVISSMRQTGLPDFSFPSRYNASQRRSSCARVGRKSMVRCGLLREC